MRLDDDLAADTEALARAEGTSMHETVKQALRASRQVTIEYLDLADFALRMFVDINGWHWGTRPNIEDAEAAVVAIAAANGMSRGRPSGFAAPSK